MDDTRPDPTRRYAAGLPHRGTRRLEAHDRRWLESRLRRQRAGVLLAAGTLGLVALTVHLGAEARPDLAHLLYGRTGMGLVALGAIGILRCLVDRGWWRGLALVGAGYLGGALAADVWLPALDQPRWLTAEVLVGTTVLGLSNLARHVIRRLRLLRRLPRIRADLSEGRLECFEGKRPDTPLEGALARLHQSGALSDDPLLRLELLPRSGVVVRAGDRRVEPWITAHMVDVAPAQPHALRVELPRGVAPAAPDPGLCLKRRSLTADERAELERHITRLRRRWWPVVALTVVVAGLVAWDIRTRAVDRLLPLDGTSLGWLALLVVVYVVYGRRVLAARKLEHDRRLRWVVTVHQDAADPRRDPPNLEVLPISQLAWTEDTAPAGWRLSRL